MTQRRLAVQEAPEATVAMLAEAARALGMKRVPPCRQSARLHTPVVVGMLRPSVVVPTNFGAAFTTVQQRLLLAHELAHIARADTWRNAAQCVVEMFLFWHPAVLWISRRLRHERELCCDERAAMLLSEAPALAHALALLAEDAAARPCPRLAANRSSLIERARMLASAQFPRPLYRWRLACALALMPLTLLAAVYAHVISAPVG